MGVVGRWREAWDDGWINRRIEQTKVVAIRPPLMLCSGLCSGLRSPSLIKAYAEHRPQHSDDYDLQNRCIYDDRYSLIMLAVNGPWSKLQA